MPRNARVAAIAAALFGLSFLLAAIWFPENFWKLIVSSVIMLVVSMIIMAVVQPSVGNKR